MQCPCVILSLQTHIKHLQCAYRQAAKNTCALIGVEFGVWLCYVHIRVCTKTMKSSYI